MRHKVIAYTDMTEHNALGLAGGAGGIDHIGKLIAGHFDIGVSGIAACQNRGNINGVIGSVVAEPVACCDNI